MLKVGDLVKWYWHLHTDWTQTHFTGVIVGSRVYANTTWDDKCIVFQVLDNTGQVVDVREDEASLEIVSPALSDEQLENVVGGMSTQKFSEWRTELINERR